jgi:hypothetical protein
VIKPFGGTKMKLSDLMPTSAQMELVHPTKGKLGVFLSIVGQDSKQYREVSKVLMRDRLANKEKVIDVDKVEQDNATLIASCIVGWSDDEALGGPYTPQRATELMMMPELSWIREEVQAFITERSNFFQ